MSLLRRMILMNHGSITPPEPVLPYDAEVEYLESTGTQYINLNFGFDKTDEVYTSFAILTTTNDKYINSPITWNDNNNRFGMGFNNRWACAYGNASTANTLLSPYTAKDNNIHNWEYKNYTFNVTDLNLTKSVSSITFGGTTAKLRLFWGYNAATKGKISSYKHIKNGNIVVDLIPVRKGTVGYMYDRISGQLFGNSGTGSFILGNDVN